AMLLGLLRDRMAAFFTVLFPLFFLLLFGALFQNDSSDRVVIAQVGDVAMLDEMSAEQLAALDDAMTLQRTADRDEALREVREGDIDGVIWEEEDGQVELRYSAA